MEEPQKENLQVAYGVDAKSGMPFVILKIEGEDRYVLTPTQAEALGRAFFEKAAFANYEAAAYEHIASTGCPKGAKSIIEKFRNRIEERKSRRN